MSKWLYLYIFFVFSGLIYPFIYVFNLDGAYGGALLKVPSYFVYIILFGFFIYPFAKAVEFYKDDRKMIGLGLLIIGVIMPIFSGVFGILFFEFMGKFIYRKKEVDPVAEN